MECIILLLCVIGIVVIAINMYLIVDFYKQVKRAEDLNDRHEEALKEFVFKNNLRGEKWD